MLAILKELNHSKFFIYIEALEALLADVSHAFKTAIRKGSQICRNVVHKASRCIIGVSMQANPELFREFEAMTLILLDKSRACLPSPQQSMFAKPSTWMYCY